ncbi:hydroxyisourate hydrolase [Oceanibacterium hippocampi]|uniref:5-hydroxyisourate hydrolase n=1 Tax=Oceanibacterium hippocampi TaxID=745714 RepID=A0A1Y5U0G7_9PROT|nr:hydroxyisourate hydrolase [Oceanibacterium hippocampi]SLN75982.1 5-hydroxyisourate hydrolase [Oceanibacterium hippocampi]
MGRLTTHVLDTARGMPAAGLRIELFGLDGALRHALGAAVTNADGRCDAPLLSDDSFRVGDYELLFHAGAYFDGLGVDLPTPKFLDIVPIRFGIADPAAHYHVPLLLSPFGYSTYRGS